MKIISQTQSPTSAEQNKAIKVYVKEYRYRGLVSSATLISCCHTTERKLATVDVWHDCASILKTLCYMILQLVCLWLRLVSTLPIRELSTN